MKNYKSQSILVCKHSVFQTGHPSIKIYNYLTIINVKIHKMSCLQVPQKFSYNIFVKYLNFLSVDGTALSQILRMVKLT